MSTRGAQSRPSSAPHAASLRSGRAASAGAAPHARPRTPLLEREREIAAIAAALEAAREERGRVVVLQAPGGVGKSALLDAARELALDAGMTVLSARGAALEQQIPFGVARELLTDAVARAGGPQRLQGSAALAAGLLGGVPDADQQAGSLLHGLFWTTVGLAEAAPTAVLIDDAHLADEASLRFVAYLARRIADLPIAVLLAKRPRRRPPEPLLDLLASGGVTLLSPEPLTATAVATRVAEWRPDADEAFVEACHDVTGGNPLLLRELLRALGGEHTEPDGRGAARVREIGPEPVGRAVLLALSRLPRAATDLARAVAVLGEDAPVDVAAALARIDEDTALASAAALVEAGVFAPSDRPAFKHPIVRAAVYEELLPSERQAAHREAGRLLGAAGAAAEQIAGHVLRARPARDPDAVAVLRRVAAVSVDRGEPGAAVPFLRRALEEPPEPDLAGTVALELARCEAAAGLPEAVDRLARVRDAAASPIEAASISRELGAALYAAGRFEEALRAYDEGRRRLAGADPSLDAELEAGWLHAGLWAGIDAPELHERLAAILASTPRGAAARNLRAAVAGIEVMRARDAGRVVALALSAWGAGALLDDVPLSDPVLWAVTGALLNAGAYDEADAVVDRILEAARAAGSFDVYATASYVHASILLARGSIAEAEECAGVALSAARDGWQTYYPATLGVVACCRLERGDIAAAQATTTLDEAAERRWRDTPVYGALLHARGLVALESGEPNRALAAFEELGTVFAPLGSRNPSFYGWRAGAALALARLGRREEARAHADADVAVAREFGVPAILGESLRVRATVERPQDAIAMLEEAVELVADGPARLTAARTLVALGTALRVAGKRTAARDRLRQGLDLAAACGATALAGRARGELVAAGGRPRRERTSGATGLTPSELRVVRLAVEGSTNREIAEALFVTRKAVEFHLANAFRKLDVSRRGDLSAALERSTA